MTVSVGAVPRPSVPLWEDAKRLGWLLATYFTNRGQEWAANRLVGGAATTGQYVGWGTGSGGNAASTALVTPADSRVSGTVSLSGSGSAAKYQVVATITAGAPRAITEAGNFETSGAASDIIVYGDFTVINLAAGDGIQFTITIDPQ